MITDSCFLAMKKRKSYNKKVLFGIFFCPLLILAPETLVGFKLHSITSYRQQSSYRLVKGDQNRGIELKARK
jgi:hypothetical protein